jgi:organic radical activating enzyme
MDNYSENNLCSTIGDSTSLLMKMSTPAFVPYQPPYSLTEKLQRAVTIAQATATVASHLLRGSNTKFAASIEITDRCNAGCHYCYVYPPEWTQHDRVEGYLQLSKPDHERKEAQVFETLERLHRQGIVHVTLVGGEPALAPKAIEQAAALFPVVWVVTNGSIKLPSLPRSVSVFVSLDGLPEAHNRARDPLGFFANHRYKELTGMTAAIARNIDQSERGAYVHLTLTRSAIAQFSATIDWLVANIDKLRGIVVSGTTAASKTDPVAFTPIDRQQLKQAIVAAAQKYGWQLFPFNQPTVNEFLFDEEHIIHSPADCSVANRVESLNFNGDSVGKCILRDEMDCETCMCNITGLARAIDRVDINTISSVMNATFG